MSLLYPIYLPRNLDLYSLALSLLVQVSCKQAIDNVLQVVFADVLSPVT